MVSTVEITETVLVSDTGNNLRPKRIFAPAATMLNVCKDLGANGATKTRSTIAKELERSYSGANPEEDTETIVSVALGKADFSAIEESIIRLGLGIEDAPEDFEASLPEPETPKRAPAKKQARECGCGCGGMTGGGTYLPGHDMKLRSALIKRVDKEGDTQAAADLVSHSWWSQAEADTRLEKYRSKSAEAKAKKEAKAEDEAPAEVELPDEEGNFGDEDEDELNDETEEDEDE